MTPDDTPCHRAWRKFAPDKGFDPDHRGTYLKMRDGAMVVAFGDIVAKYVQGHFGRTLRAHRQAWRGLRDHSKYCAAGVLGWDEDDKVVFMERIRGKTLLETIIEGGRPEALLVDAGGWLRAFHDMRPGEMRKFDAMGPLNRLPGTADLMPEHFALERAKLSERAVALHGTEQPFRVLHGDLHGDNLILADGRMVGIDFENIDLHPAMRDAGTLLAMLHRAAVGRVESFFPDAWREAFETGYGTCGDALVFFAHQRFLEAWARVPGRAADRGEVMQDQADVVHALFGR